MPDDSKHDNRALNPREILRSLALLAAGATGADIERIVRELGQKARRDKKPMSWSDIETALSGNRPAIPDDLRWRLAVHEAGHAVAWTRLGVGDVDLAAIGVGMGGSGMVTGRYASLVCQDEDWVTSMIACDLAGRAAELIVFGDALAGSGGSDTSDLALATERALQAETILGFSDHQPLLYRKARQGVEMLALDGDLRNSVNARLEAAMARARTVLTEYPQALDNVAKALVARHVLDGNEVRAIIGAAIRPLTAEDGSPIPG